MSIAISYMGTKRTLAPTVAQIISTLRPGLLLDAFSGMCAVASAVGVNRQIWCNDALAFPSLVASCLLKSNLTHPNLDQLTASLRHEFQRNFQTLSERFESLLAREERGLRRPALASAQRLGPDLPYVGNDPDLEHERSVLAASPARFPYRLFSLSYMGSFFGVKQCLEIDSIRFAIDRCADVGLIDGEQRQWLIGLLGQVLSKTNNSTGQFAQFLLPTSQNLSRVVQKRRRSVWGEFVQSLAGKQAIGTRDWRSGNRVFCEDASSLLQRLSMSKTKPSVVYADPPYSKEQYSRYYHVLEVLVHYNYPKLTGAGRYPVDRFHTSFSTLRSVESAMDEFFTRVANLGASLVLSYPDNGLLFKRGRTPEGLLRRYFRVVRVAGRLSHEHSTFGARAAPSRVRVHELVYVAKI